MYDSGLRWRKSSRTNGGNGAQCVELACLDHGGAIRDTKQQSGPMLTVDARAFRTFLSTAAAGRLDLEH
ncbi:DUF397 domain-containing protein [Actinokineospora enzanensis]|uniref:DUF397 domain-containing protein n=1 Tax=Actinokineospora enzanensis TaxID=155975 RepID=UPI00036EF491|nr:DUF397 domain-containing protein [Actinokineospora enzanensis]